MIVPVFLFIVLQLFQVSTQHSMNPRVTNGYDSIRNQFLFLASIQTTIPPLRFYFHVCSGTIIDQDWILTTAICIEKLSGPNAGRVKTGMYFTDEESDIIQTIGIADTIVHEYYNSSSPSILYDIGLIQLQTSILDAVVVKLSHTESNQKDEVVMIGWGKSSPNFFGSIPELLKYGSVEILDNTNCMKLLSDLEHPKQLMNSQLCTYSPGNKVTPSPIDVGGPIIRYVNDAPEIIGIISSIVPPNNHIDVPTVCTRVSSFVDWIDEKNPLIQLLNDDSDDNDELEIKFIRPR